MIRTEVASLSTAHSGAFLIQFLREMYLTEQEVVFLLAEHHELDFDQVRVVRSRIRTLEYFNSERGEANQNAMFFTAEDLTWLGKLHIGID